MDNHAPILPSTVVYTAKDIPTNEAIAVHRALPLAPHEIGHLNPFLQLDHIGPGLVGPQEGVHRGVKFPLVGVQSLMLVYQGDYTYRQRGVIESSLEPGDLHWLTAGGGVVYEQESGRQLNDAGGMLERIELRINLPAQEKFIDPIYKTYRADIFPIVDLSGKDANGLNYARLLAGEWGIYRGPLKTFSPLTLADIYLDEGMETTIELNHEWHTGLYVIKGGGTVNDEPIVPFQLALIKDENRVTIRTGEPMHLLFMSGAPLNEPIVSYGSYYLNTQEEVEQAVEKFG